MYINDLVMCVCSLSLIHGIFITNKIHIYKMITYTRCVTWKIWIGFSFSIWFSYSCRSRNICVCIPSCNVASAQSQHTEHNILYINIYIREQKHEPAMASKHNNNNNSSSNHHSTHERGKTYASNIKNSATFCQLIHSIFTHWHTITRDSHAWLPSHAFYQHLSFLSMWISNKILKKNFPSFWHAVCVHNYILYTYRHIKIAFETVERVGML